MELRRTLWDKRSLGLDAIEVLNVQYGDEAGLFALLRSLDEYCDANGIDLAYLRIDAMDKVAKKALNHAGFEFIETSLKVVNQNIQKYNFSGVIPARFQLQELSAEDIPQMVVIARDAFRFGRFHEDYNIPDIAARQRYANWIDDLLAQEKSFLVYKAGGVVKSFVIYETRTEGSINLILAGSEAGQGYLSPFFWSSFLTTLRERGGKRVEALISAANIPAVNLYTTFGFTVEQTYFGFHKYLSGSLCGVSHEQ